MATWPRRLTTPDYWPSDELPPLPPLVLAEVATEFVSMEQTPPEIGLHCVISIDRHGSLTQLFSVTTYVYRFIDNLGVQPQRRLTRPISSGKETCLTAHLGDYHRGD